MDPEFLTAPEQDLQSKEAHGASVSSEHGLHGAVLLGILPGANPTELKQMPTKLMP